MGPPQQSLVLKHIETWKRCVARGFRRVLVFEDDAMLAANFSTVFGAAMRGADRIEQPYMIYLGCGDNKYVAPPQQSDSLLVRTNLALPATDATVFDQRTARLRLEYVARQKITRPADWQYLLILAETGLLGLVAFAWFLFSAARQYVRGAFGVVGIALLVAWSLTSLFSSHFHTFNEGHLIAMLLGVCLARESPAATQSRSAESTADRTA